MRSILIVVGFIAGISIISKIYNIMSVGNKTKTNKKKFASLSKELKSMKSKDPIQFNVLYNEWIRKQRTSP